ncbi:MAG: hypothetical protein A3I78_03285 [Gammaproteobacteria bacterium RIFCSPLOWO2_02_FULL_56_15]|nr:MAG: hypothetical protein A3I78_03285 [Gammaproteobacteria bacterium RIFCSPLOWO2_02_FULL_56_15]
MPEQLVKEFQFYIDHQADLVKRHNGKYVVIVENEVIGIYDDELTAINETRKEHEMGFFLVQKVEPGKDSYTQTFHSRVAFH